MLGGTASEIWDRKVLVEQACIGLRIGDCDDDVRQAIANKIIDLAKTGERNPDLICELILKDMWSVR
jgi:hypothetical protein